MTQTKNTLVERKLEVIMFKKITEKKNLIESFNELSVVLIKMFQITEKGK